jgi:hypothetical protein
VTLAGLRAPSDQPSGIEQAVAGLAGVPLADVGQAALDRLDRKFLLPVEAAPDVLRRTSGYGVLEVDGRRLGRYRTVYLDTPDLALYNAHHAGQLPRSKVRIRTYLETGERYLEVKRKTKRGRTEKWRLPLRAEAVDLVAGLARASAAGVDAGVPTAELQEALVVDFTRLTLIARDAPERVTVDVGLTLARERSVCRLPGLAVIEVKQERPGPSRFLELLRSLGFRGGGLSKYCMGVAVLESAAKRNRFKPVLRRVAQLGGSPLVLLDHP